MQRTAVSYSLSEVDALATKAARGVGYEWGLAEEAGRATRWLCQQGADGCSVLTTYLQRIDGLAFVQYSPRMQSDSWFSNGSILCPLMAGAALSDGSGDSHGSTLRLLNVAEPGLLMFFAAQYAQRLAGVLVLSWNGSSATTDGENMMLNPGNDLHALIGVHDVQIEFKPQGALKVSSSLCTRATPANNVWSALNDFASRTYAPATEDSRLKGAGAGLSDND